MGCIHLPDNREHETSDINIDGGTCILVTNKPLTQKSRRLIKIALIDNFISIQEIMANIEQHCNYKSGSLMTILKMKIDGRTINASGSISAAQQFVEQTPSIDSTRKENK